MNQVWSSDITYIRLHPGFVYLVAIIDWFSRFVLSWEVSITLESNFCVAALDWALQLARPAIFNTDQGAQFTSNDFTGRLLAQQIQISMDGRGRALDNIFVERLWRTVKYEDIYLKEYRTIAELLRGLATYFTFYNEERLHEALGYRTPAAVYRQTWLVAAFVAVALVLGDVGPYGVIACSVSQRTREIGSAYRAWRTTK